MFKNSFQELHRPRILQGIFKVVNMPGFSVKPLTWHFMFYMGKDVHVCVYS